MNLPVRAVNVITTLYNSNLTLARGTEDDRRKLTRKIAEQLCFDLGKDWGTKSTSPSAPQSKDAIAFYKGNGIMDIWDWQNGTSREPRVFPDMPPDYLNTTGQNFISVSPVDHIGGTPGNGNGNGGTVDLKPILDKIEELEDLITAHNELLHVMAGEINILVKTGITVTFPEYVSNDIRFFGVVTLKPKKSNG